MAGRRKFRVPQLQGLPVWLAVTLLLAAGLLTTLIDLFHLPTQEVARATEQRQRFVINAASGAISLGDSGEGAAQAAAPEKFDVASKSEIPPSPPAPVETAPVVAATKTAPAPTNMTAPAAEAAANPAVLAPAEAAAPPTEIALPANTPVLRTEPYGKDLTTVTRTNISLVSAPAPEVTEVENGLHLPKRGANSIIPSSLYAHPFKRKADQLLLSFVVIDAGMDPQSIGLLLNLPPEITVAYSPYAHPDTTSENLRAAGHEVWTMLPAMGEHYPADDPGPMGIITRMPGEEIIRRVQEVLAAVPGSVGIVLPPDEIVSQQKNGLANVFKEIDDRGMFALSTHPSHSIEQLTPDKKMAAAMLRRADLILDPTPNESHIKSKLAALLDSAKEKGEYLVVLSARPQSLQLLSAWLKENPLAEPFTLAPLSGLYQPQEAPEAAESKPEQEKPKEKKKEAKPKPPKVLPQDQYRQPPDGKDGEAKKPEAEHH